MKFNKLIFILTICICMVGCNQIESFSNYEDTDFSHSSNSSDNKIEKDNSSNEESNIEEIDLNDIGFQNFCGIKNVWVDIEGYNFQNNEVKLTPRKDKNKILVYIFYENYWQSGFVDASSIKTSQTIDSSDFIDEYIRTVPYKLLSNDVISYDGKNGWGPITITERSVNGKTVIIKTNDGTGNEDRWYVPIDCLDLDNIREEYHSDYVNTVFVKTK